MSGCGGIDGCCRGDAPEAILTALIKHEEWLDRRGWDRPPELRWITRDPDYLQDVEIIASNVPWELYGDDRPYIVAARVAVAIALTGTVPPMPRGRILTGVAFASEGWGAIADEDGPPAELKYTEALIAERMLHTHRQRLECRMVEAVDLDGHEYSVGRIRGQGVQSHTWRAGSSLNYRGDAVAALRALATVLAHPEPQPDYRTVFGLT